MVEEGTIRCVVLKRGAHGLPGDIVIWKGKGELPHTLRRYEEVAAEKAPSQGNTSPIPTSEDGVTPEKIRASALRGAIGLLDAKNDSHWTEQGQPSIGALNTVLQQLGDEATTRAEVRLFVPDGVRPKR